MELGRICVLLMVSLFALVAIQLRYYWQGIVIFAAIALGSIMRKSKINTCPHCGELIGTGEQWSYFTKWLFLRKDSRCSNCEVRLIRAKWPWRMTQSGMVLVLTCIFIRFSNTIPPVALRPIVWVSLLLFLVGIYTSRFEVMDK